MRLYWCLALLLVFCAALPVFAQDRFAIGPLYPGISTEDAREALPNANWEVSRRTYGVVASADAAAPFIGQTWDVAIGNAFPEHRNSPFADPGVTLTRRLMNTRRAGCHTLFNETVTALEALVGPFGTYVGFENPRSPLYGNPYGEGMRIDAIGARSRMRTWRDPEWEPSYTFREADESLPYVVEVGAEFVSRERECTIKIKFFENDELRQRSVASPVVLPRQARYNQAEQMASMQRLAPPEEFTKSGMVAARYNLVRWRDTEYTQFADASAFSGFEGYFAVIGDSSNPGGIVRGRWQPQTQELDASYLHPHRVCGAELGLGNVSIDEIVYLGSTERAEFSALDDELGGNAMARNLDGRASPTGAPLLGWQTPPAASDFSRFYPSEAMRREIEGSATLSCLVQSALTLRCAVLIEDPIGYGFGVAAIRTLQNPMVRVAPAFATGEPSVGACINRRLVFRLH